MLDGFFPNTGNAFAQIDSRPVIGEATELAEWDVFRKASGWQGGAAIHIDTGMNDSVLPWRRRRHCSHVSWEAITGITLVMSHLVSAETPSHPMNAHQVATFREIASQFPDVPASLANSSGIFLKDYFHFDMVRPGAALYGVNPTPQSPTPMKPVVDLKVRIVQTRDIDRGETVGYGATWTARRPTHLAIISAGYADGYFRAAGGVDGTRSAEVVVAGQRCPVAGRISMDLMAIDVTDVPRHAVRRGGTVTLIGEGITHGRTAYHFGTIGYEVLTSLGNRYARVYRGGE